MMETYRFKLQFDYKIKLIAYFNANSAVNLPISEGVKGWKKKEVLYYTAVTWNNLMSYQMNKQVNLSRQYLCMQRKNYTRI